MNYLRKFFLMKTAPNQVSDEELKKYSYKELQKLTAGTGISAFNKKKVLYVKLKKAGVI